MSEPTGTEDTGTVAVVGVGSTGAEIAVLLARAGNPVVAVDPDVDGAMARLRRLDPATSIQVTAALDAVAGCDVVVEALPERLELKRSVLQALPAVAPDGILVSTALVLPVGEIVAGTAFAGRACGIRYVGPLPATVELVRPPGATDATERVAALLTGAGVGMVPADDHGFPGVAVALLMGMLNRAVRMHDAGLASRADLDAAVRDGCGWRHGPLELLDLIGLDTALDVLIALYQRTGLPTHAPAPLLRRLVAAGLLGRKTDGGFHSRPRVPQPAGRPSGSAAPIERLGVVGTGTMAVGIAAASVTAGYATVIVGRTADRASTARSAAVDLAERAGQSAPDWLLTASTELSDLAGCGLVVEAVVEDLDVKRELFAALDRVCWPGAVLATTTSSLPVIDCAMATARHADVVGMHFFNPVQAMPLVELVTTERSGHRAAAVAADVATRLGKRVVQCADRAGFLVNRLVFPYLNDAVAAVARGEVDADSLDLVLRRVAGLPLGPLRLLDMVGTDVALTVQTNLFHEFGDPELAPHPALMALVAGGALGRKAGHGVRDGLASVAQPSAA